MNTFSLAPIAPLLVAAGLASAAPLGAGLDKAGFDPSARPQDDLFRTANGRWIDTTEIPADKPSYGTFIQLRDKSDREVRAIVEELASKKQDAGSVEQKIAAFYGSFVDTAAIDSAGLAPVKASLARIDAIQSPQDLAAWMGSVQGVVNTPIALWVMADYKDPSTNRALTWQGGLGMPDRDYYLKDDERFAKARAAYQTYLETLARLSGDKNAEATAKQVFALEKRIAEAHWDKVDNRDPVKIYNPMTPDELARSAPGIDWARFLESGRLGGTDRLSLSQPGATKAIARMLGETPLPELKNYLKLRTLDDAADVLPKEFREARFAFHGRTLTGAMEDKPRWQKGIKALDGALGEAVGQVYVARHFPPANKARMQELVGNLMQAYGQSIDGLTWMSPATKVQAKDKLSKYVTKIAYPDRWRDYGKLTVKEGDAFGNHERAGRFEWQRVSAKAGKPVDRGEWMMTPQTVNAYYNGSLNEIVFPAAILQPPFFDMAADDAVNYGAIGAVIGHEISHGFDDQGSKFNGDGKLQDWWGDEDRKAFDALGARLVAQYETYEPIPGHKLNGKLTLGENIADLSGLQIAYKAYKLSLKGKDAPVIDGYTGEQRFFLGWSQAWRDKVRSANGENVAVPRLGPAEAPPPLTASSCRWCSLSWQYRQSNSQLLPSGGLLSWL